MLNSVRLFRLPAALATLALLGCAASQPTVSQTVGAPGFFLGLWHGFISPAAFIMSLFFDSVRIYSFPNAGAWYDFGFMLGIGGFSGGVFAGSKKR